MQGLDHGWGQPWLWIYRLTLRQGGGNLVERGFPQALQQRGIGCPLLCHLRRGHGLHRVRQGRLPRQRVYDVLVQGDRLLRGETLQLLM